MRQTLRPAKRKHWQNIKAHAKRRVFERFGIEVSRKNRHEFWDACAKGKPVCEGTEPGTIVRFFYFQGQPLLGVFDHGRGMVRTVLPKTDSRWLKLHEWPESLDHDVPVRGRDAD